jgi:hypothetical protein
MAGPPDNSLEQDPEVGVGLADQDPCHGLNVGAGGREAVSGSV